jgi:hypothetical protein
MRKILGAKPFHQLAVSAKGLIIYTLKGKIRVLGLFVNLLFHRKIFFYKNKKKKRNLAVRYFHQLAVSSKA